MNSYRIDFFSQVSLFDYLCKTDALPGITGNYRSVYFALLSINNATFWSETFEVDFDFILRLSRVDKDTYRRAMDFFNKNGLFDFYQKGVNKYARAKLTLRVLTENPVGTTVGNLVADTASSAHNIKTRDSKPTIENKNIDTINNRVENFDCDPSTKVLESEVEEKEKSSGKKEKEFPSLEIAISNVSDTAYWRNVIEHHLKPKGESLTAELLIELESERERLFRIFYEQKEDHYRIKYPAKIEMVQHFFNWVPVYKAKLLRGESSNNKATNGITKYKTVKNDYLQNRSELQDLMDRSREFLKIANPYRHSQ